MGKEDGSIARRGRQCSQGIDWKKSKVVVTERNTKQRKVTECIKSEKRKFRSSRRLEIGDPRICKVRASHKRLKRKIFLMKGKETSKYKEPVLRKERGI